jgi:hypothetical protein
MILLHGPQPTFFSRRATAGHGRNSDGAGQAKEWKSIWSVQAPNKMAHDCLPTGFQLQRRHMPADEACVFCNKSELVEHLFLMCPFAHAVWYTIKEIYPVKINRNSMSNMKQWLFDYLGKASEKQATTLAVTCWFIWGTWNDARNDKGLLHPD